MSNQIERSMLALLVSLSATHMDACLVFEQAHRHVSVAIEQIFKVLLQCWASATYLVSVHT